MQINAERLKEVEAVMLQVGAHDDWNNGACVMEAVAYVAGERWSDHPQCACPMIASFLRSWNDRLPNDKRQDLKQYIPLLIGSKASAAVEAKRSWMLTDWAVRECAPLWLRRAGMDSQADILAGMAPINSDDTYRSVRLAIEAIREETWPKRQAWHEELKAKIKEKLAGKKFADAAADAVAAADAAADADAVAVAAADAAADAAAVAVAAADAVAAAVAAADAVAVADAAAAAVAVAAAAADADAAAAADAAADADAVAVAAAAAVADAVAGSDRWWAIYSKVRDAIREKVGAIVRDKLGDTYEQSYQSAHELVRRLLAVK